MKHVDYTRIARTYDDLPKRMEVPIDTVLGDAIRTRPQGPFRVLDIGCGTGTYLATQFAALHRDGVEWHGLDPSDAMLERARAKQPAIGWQTGSAEQLPFADASVDAISCRFAFHHFPDKPRALDEMARVAHDDACLFLMNVAPERMSGWWVFDWFPETRAVNERYWPVEKWLAEVSGRGFDARMEIFRSDAPVPIAAALAQARVRDQSHLVAIDDDAWERGLRRLEAAALADPARDLPSETVVVEIRGRRIARGSR